MLESLLAPLGGVALAFIRRVAGKPHFQIFAYVEKVEYENRPGAYLALVVKVANVGKETAYFDRIEGRTANASRVSFLFFGVEDQAAISPNRSVTGYVPAAFLLDHDVVELHVYDAVERRYVLKKRTLNRLQSELRIERARLEALGYQVKWQPE